MSDSKALDISNLHAGYGETEILKGINLSVKSSEIVAIIAVSYTHLRAHET